MQPIPSPRALDHADHRLPAGVHINVLDRDFLLAPLAAVAIERDGMVCARCARSSTDEKKLSIAALSHKKPGRPRKSEASAPVEKTSLNRLGFRSQNPV
jgi:hypothetical protein